MHPPSCPRLWAGSGLIWELRQRYPESRVLRASSRRVLGRMATAATAGAEPVDRRSGTKTVSAASSIGYYGPAEPCARNPPFFKVQEGRRLDGNIEKISLPVGSVGAATSARPAAPASAAPSAASGSGPAPKPAYPPPAPIPTQEGPGGMRFDFNEGCRVMVPEGQHPWRVRISDLDTGNILYETEIKAGRVSSTKRYYIRFKLELWQQGESVLAHEYAAEGR